MAGTDSRLVQTAVIGDRNSERAIVLPTDADELARWRRRHPRYTYWCGIQLGGCGNELSDRLCRDKICRFAHHPPTSCHRTATGANSADHLFIKEDLAAWAGRHRLKWRTTSHNLGTGPGDAVDFRVGQAGQHVRFQFSRLPHALDRLGQMDAPTDHRPGPCRRPPLVLPTVCGRSLGRLRLRPCELLLAQPRQRRRPLRPQSTWTALLPRFPPPLHQPDIHPQVFGDHRARLAPGEPLGHLET